MLNLANTSSKVQLITDAAVTVDVYAAYVDYSAGAATPGAKHTAISTAATTDIVAVPAASTTRNVKELHIANKHASTAVTVTVQITDGTTIIELEKIVLLAGERLSYIEGVGFVVHDSSGLVKVQAAGAVFVKSLAADQSNSTTTLTNVTGIELACGVGTWIFQYNVIYQAAAATTGVRFSVNHDGTVTSFVANRRYGGGTAASSDVPDQDLVAAGAQIISAFSARAKSTLGWGTTLSVDTAGADMFEIIEGSLVCSIAGNIELWHGSEVAAASTVKGGTGLMLVKVG